MSLETFSESEISKHVRETLGFSQRELGSCLQVSSTTVQRWENGTSTPQPHVFAALSVLNALILKYKGDSASLRRLRLLLKWNIWSGFEKAMECWIDNS